MFVRSLMDRDVIYRKGGYDWVIKAGTVTYIDENKVTARELKGLYGSRIIIVSRDIQEDKIAERVIRKKETPIFVKEKEPELDEKLIDEIISQIETEKAKDDIAEQEAKEKAEKERLEKEAKEKAEKEKLEKETKVTVKPKAVTKRRGRRKSAK